MSKYQEEYDTFFTSPAGLQFLTFIHKGIDNAHEASEEETNKDVVFGYSKTAKAYRGIVKHIQSVTGKDVSHP